MMSNKTMLIGNSPRTAEPDSARHQATARKTNQPSTETDEIRKKILAENYKFGQARKRVAKLRSADESRTLAGMLTAFGCDFGAIGGLLLSPTSSTDTKFTRGLVRSWLRSRYWGDTMILSDVLDLPWPSTLSEWKRLPADVAQFFKLLHVLAQPNAVFVTCRLDPEIGEQALHAERGPCDWLAERIRLALRGIGLPTEHMAFNIEFAPGQAKTLHRLHIHGAFCIPADRRAQAMNEIKKVLAPAYKTHGRNVAVKIEEPQSAPDVARYIPKEARITEPRIHKTRGSKKGAGAHRASKAATSGGRAVYRAMNQLVYGNPFSYAGWPDFS